MKDGRYSFRNECIMRLVRLEPIFNKERAAVIKLISRKGLSRKRKP
jgi:hypothetical protein